MDLRIDRVKGEMFSSLPSGVFSKKYFRGALDTAWYGSMILCALTCFLRPSERIWPVCLTSYSIWRRNVLKMYITHSNLIDITEMLSFRVIWSNNFIFFHQKNQWIPFSKCAWTSNLWKSNKCNCFHRNTGRAKGQGPPCYAGLSTPSPEGILWNPTV